MPSGLSNLRAKTIFDKRALVVEHLAMTWNCIVEKLCESLVEVGLQYISIGHTKTTRTISYGGDVWNIHDKIRLLGNGLSGVHDYNAELLST